MILTPDLSPTEVRRRKKISKKLMHRHLSEETKDKLRRPKSEETKRKISATLMGHPGAFKDKHHTPEACDKIRKARKDKHPSIVSRKKMSESKKGEKHPNFGKHLSPVTKEKIRISNSGDKCYNWKGGATKFQKSIRESSKMRSWTAAVFERDRYTCQMCKKRGGDLESHHIIPLADLLLKYDITTVDQAIECDALWDISNGITLCVKCHKQEHKNKPKPGKRS